LYVETSDKASTPAEFEHLLETKFSLDGAFRKPQTGFSLGELKRNSTVIIGITTVKVIYTLLICLKLECAPGSPQHSVVPIYVMHWGGDNLQLFSIFVSFTPFP